MQAKTIFKKLIVREDIGIIRAISLGDHLGKVIELEGDKYTERLGLFPNILYEKDMSETETIQIYYHYNAKNKLVSSIELYCKSHMYKIFKANNHNKSVNFYQALNQVGSPLTQNFTKVRDKFVQHYSVKFGTTEEIIDDTIDGFVSVYEWKLIDKILCIQYYLDMNDSIPYTRQVLKITIG